VSAIGLLNNLFVRGYHLQSSWDSEVAYSSALVSVYLNIGLLCLLAVFLVALCIDRLAMSYPVICEWSLIVVFILTMWVSILASPNYLADLRGYKMREAFPSKTCFSDSVLLMMIDGVVTVAHVGVPVRWSCLLPLDVVAAMTYGAIVFAGASGEDSATSIYCLVLISSIVTAGALSKRATEVGERVAWKNLAKERSLRCEAEFELSQREARAVARPRPRDAAAESQPESHADSLPQTTASGGIFDPLYDGDGADLEAKLGRIAEMGDAEHWRVGQEEVRVLRGEVLGSGAFGEVSRGVFCGLLVAVKRARRLDKAGLQNIPQLCNELRVLRHLKHPNIVATHGAVVNPAEHEIALVLELVEGVTLTKFMASSEQQKRISCLPRFTVMVGVCRALLYMHTRRPHIIHGDLKCGNIMVQVVGETAHPKLLDFGLSRVLTRNPRRLGGTLAWVAPEIVHGAPAKCSSDVYSFGRVIALLATGISPQEQFDIATLKRALQQGRSPLPRWPCNCVFEPTCRPIAHSCIHADEGQRPSILQVYRGLLEVPQKMGLLDVSGCFLAQLNVVAPELGPIVHETVPGSRDQAAQGRQLEPSPQESDAQSYVEASLPEACLEYASSPMSQSTFRASGSQRRWGSSTLSTVFDTEDDVPSNIVGL